jgi:hypothetical protein
LPLLLSLFNLYINDLLKQVNGRAAGLLTCLFYVDDRVLVTQRVNKAQALLVVVKA